MPADTENESSNFGSKDTLSDEDDGSLGTTGLPPDGICHPQKISPDCVNQSCHIYHESSDSNSTNDGVSQDGNVRVDSGKERPSHEYKAPATNPKVLIKEILMKWDDSGDNSKMMEEYWPKVSHAAKVWSGASGGERPTFVHFVLGEGLIDTSVKEFLFQAAVPVRWGQLSEKTPKTNGQTALHDALEKDQATRNVKREADRTNFTSFFCQLLRNGIVHKSITRADAAQIIATTNDDGENCLHLALKFDLPVAEDLIELANNQSFLQQRNSKEGAGDNGNTPLHDALEFPLELDDASGSAHKYLVQAPLCPTSSLRMPMEAYAQQNYDVVELDQEGRSLFVCEGCEEIEETYSKLKARRSRIICKLLEKCQGALKVHNNAGQSPFIYHVVTRDKFMKEHSDLEKLAGKSKSTYGEQTETISPGPKEEDSLGGERPLELSQSGLACKVPPEVTVANTKASRSPTAECGPRPILRSEHDVWPQGQYTQYTSVAEVYPLNLQRLTYYKFSEEVEQFLWEKAFCIGGYDDAHRCLFHGRGDSRNKFSYDEVHQEGAKLQRIFTPPDRVTVSTPEHYRRFGFESTLALVHLKVTPNSEDDKPQTQEEEAERRTKVSMGLIAVFEWLKKLDVRRIMKLVVEDNRDYYCNETTIGRCLEQMDEIRYLNWKRPDLSVQTIAKAVNVVEISLYSSGVRAVLSSWSDAEGLRSLKKLRKIIVDAKKGTETFAQNRDNVEYFKRKLASWYIRESKKRPEVVADIEALETRKETPRQPAASQLPTTVSRSQAWKDTIIKFTASLQRLVGNNSNEDEERISTQRSNDYVKVALLDDGMMPGWEGLGDFFSGFAWPRPSETAEDGESQTPFYVCGPQQHGNKMAKLITEACPFIELYVAKIDWYAADKAGHPSFNIEHAIAAIHWAIGKGVEVISMSWSVKLAASEIQLQELEDAIKAAHRRRILMFCAASPKKADTSKDKYWPSSCQETFSIGAANEHRVPQGDVGPDAEYLFPSADVIPNKPDGGSSAATALAAGLASLILYCLKMEMKIPAEKTPIMRPIKAKQPQATRPYRKERTIPLMEFEGGDRWPGKNEDKAQLNNPTNCDGISAAGDNPRHLIDKVFQSRTGKEATKYVDIVDILALSNGNAATYEAVTKLCLPHLNSGKQGNN